MGTVRVLRCLPEDSKNDDYKCSKWEGEPIPIECTDWNPRPNGLDGFIGITKNINGYRMFNDGPIFQVIEVDDSPDNFVELWMKVKFHKGNIIYQGDNGYEALRMIFDSDEEMINWNQFSLAYIKPEHETEELQLSLVKQNSINLELCHNPSYKVMYEAVKNSGWALQFIKPEDQTEELQLLAVKQFGFNLKYCHNPTYKVMYEAIKNMSSAIKFIKPEDQTEELQLLAVKQYGGALEYCHNPSDKVKQLHKELLEKESLNNHKK